MKVCRWGVVAAFGVLGGVATAQVNLAGVGPQGHLRVGEFDGAASTDNVLNGVGEATVVAVGHFTAGASYDVILRRDGRFHRWSFNSFNERTSTLNLCPAPEDLTGTVGVGDFDGDGNRGFVVQNAANGKCFAYEIDNVTGAFTYRLALGVPGNAAFTHAVGVADLNEDGAMDIVVQNPTNRRLRYRLYNGVERQELTDVVVDEAGQVAAPNGCVAGATRVNGVLYLLVNPVNPEGRKRVWQMNGNVVVSNMPLAGWKAKVGIAAVGADW